MDKNNIITKITPKYKKTNVMIDEIVWEKFKKCSSLLNKNSSEYLRELIEKELSERKNEFEDLYRKEFFDLFERPPPKKLFEDLLEEPKKNKQT